MPTAVEADAVVQRAVPFNMFSKALTADETLILKELGMDEPDGRRRLLTTASSSIKDLSGDEMTKGALEMMRATAEQNMTIFLNHQYVVPKDIFGSVEKAWLIERGGDIDLDMIIRVNENNPDAISTHEAIKDGTKLGCSIGALIPEGGATRTKSGLKIDQCQLLEASIVGIPANPKSFVQYATKALQKAVLDDAPMDEIESSGPPKPLFAAAGANQSGLPEPDLEKGTTTWAKTKADGTVDIVVEQTDDTEASSEGADEGGKSSTAEKDEEPTITKDAAAADEAENSDTDAGDEPETTTEATQDAPVDESTPENDGVADEAAVEKQIEVAKLAGLDTLADLLKTVTGQLVAKTEELRAERDEHIVTKGLLSDANADLETAKQIVEVIASLPLGRRTAFKAAVSDFRTKLSGVYSDDVIDLIERGT